MSQVTTVRPEDPAVIRTDIDGDRNGGIAMRKKVLILAVVFAVSVFFSGCSDKKPADLTPERENYIKELTNLGVYSEICSKYGLEPGVTVDKITAYDDSPKEYYHMTFYTSGSYSVLTDSNEVYSGTFKVKGHIESHGAGTDSVEITEPKNGSSVLPEQSIVLETTDDTVKTAEETTETTLYQPFSEYVYENAGTMGTVIEDIYESDINKDGHAELCSTVITGSGIISSLIVVYDMHNDKGYMLNDRLTYDYSIIGASEDDIAILRKDYPDGNESYGTLSIEGDELVFVENAEYGATVPVAN